MDSETAAADPQGLYPEGDAISTFDFTVYARAGLTRAEAIEWARRGVRPYQAEGFIRAGYQLDDAARFTRDGITGQFALRCHDEGKDPVAELLAVRAEKDAQRRRSEADRAAQEALVANARSAGQALVAKVTAQGSGFTLGIGEIADLSARENSQVSRWFGSKDTPGTRLDVHTVLEFLAERDIEPRVTPEWAWGVVVQSLEPGSRSIEAVAALVVMAQAARGRTHGIEAHSKRLISQWDLENDTDADEFRRIAALVDDGATAGETIGDPAPLLATLQADRGWRKLVECLDLAIDADLDPAILLDDAMKALTDPGSTESVMTTPHALAEVMVNLAETSLAPSDSSDSPLVVFDPAAGTAELLIQCAARFGARTHRPVQLIGHEIDPATARIGRARLLLRSLPGRIDIVDSVRSNDELPEVDADIVIADLPYTNDRSKLDHWIDLAVGSLKPGGKAVLMLPPNALPTLSDTRGVTRPAPLARTPSHLEGLALFSPRIRPGARDVVAVAVLSAEESASFGFVALLNPDLLSAKVRKLRPSRRSTSTEQATRRSRDWVQHWVAQGGQDWPQRLTVDELADAVVDAVAEQRRGKESATAPSSPGRSRSQTPPPGVDARTLAKQLLSSLSDSDEDRHLAESLRTRFGLER